MQSRADLVIVLRNIEPDNTNDAHLSRAEAQGYRLHYVRPDQNALEEIERIQPLVACFQFDHPELRGLAELRLAKEHLPAIPLIMITQAHSESLAVWAFRTRVWDYFVQPVDLERFLAVINALFEFRGNSGQTSSSPRNTLTVTNTMPSEVRVRSEDPQVERSCLELALSYVERNLHRKILQVEVAKICSLSPFQFSRLFKRKYQLTFQEYVLRKRITEAMRMLHHPGATVTDVCFNVGFNDPSHFARTFQRYVGQSPSQYRLAAMKDNEQSPSRSAGSTGAPHTPNSASLPAYRPSNATPECRPLASGSRGDHY